MRICEFEMTADPQRFIRVYPIGDLHIEKKQFDEKRLRRYIADIAADPHGLYVFVGDAIEGRTPDMAKYDPDTTRDEYKNSDYLFVIQEKLRSLFELLRARPGVVLKGNHDEYQKWSGISNYLASVSGGHYLDGEGMFRANVDLGGKSRSLIGYARHVIGGGQTAGAALTNAARMGTIADADVYVAGHIHSYASRVWPRYTIPRRGTLKLSAPSQAAIIATAFLVPRMEGVVDYAGRKGLAPVDSALGYLSVNLETMSIYREEKRY